MTTAVVLMAAGGASAADYPSKPVKIMFGFSAGGGTDTSARGFASYMHEAPDMAGMPAVIVNLPGGSGTKAAKPVKDGNADGYTLYMINAGTFAAADLAGKAKADPRTDFVNLGCVTQLVTSLQVHTSSPHQSAAEWVEAMKAGGKKVRWATSGVTTMHALIGHLFLDTVGLEHQVVPFKGGSKARNALIAQKVDAAFNGVHLTAGFENDLRVLGIPASRRDPANKEVPTFGEQGLPGLNVTGPMCLYGPTGMPDDAVAMLRNAVKHVAELQGFAMYMKKSKLAAFHLTPEQGDAALKALYTNLQPVAKRIAK